MLGECRFGLCLRPQLQEHSLTHNKANRNIGEINVRANFGNLL